MPQSLNVTAKQTSQIPEHTAETAAASHNKGTHLSAHEETVQAEDHARNQEHASKLTHGHAAAVEHASAKK